MCQIRCRRVERSVHGASDNRIQYGSFKPDAFGKTSGCDRWTGGSPWRPFPSATKWFNLLGREKLRPVVIDRDQQYSDSTLNLLLSRVVADDADALSSNQQPARRR